MKTALVNKIIPFSSIDGPGNRMVLFFQGCNYFCSYCHNPETINICNNCGCCVEHCPDKALTIDDSKVVWDPLLCSDCGECLARCPRLSSPRVKRFTSDELFEEIKKASPFLSGISCSGGEASLQIPFLTELFSKVKQETSLTCLIDSNGGVDFSSAPEFMALCDGVMLDLKAGSETGHKSLTEAPLSPVIRNIEYLKSIDKLIELRSVLAPGLNNKETVVLGASLAAQNIPYKLIPYRPYGVRKAGIEWHGTSGMEMADMEFFLNLALSLGADKAQIITPVL